MTSGDNVRRILLLDNGSKRAESVLNLRRIAADLSRISGEQVHPVSLLHADRIPADELGGETALTLGPFAERLARDGTEELIIVPLFFGPSKALTGYLPERLNQVRAQFPALRVRVAKPLVDVHQPVDLRLARVLADQVRALGCDKPDRPRVVLVDHGSPIPEVTLVRNYLAGQLSAELAQDCQCVAVASMERRDGDAYRFNEPLLENLLADPAFAHGDIILSMLFLSPGRHAGAGGDIEEIAAAAMERSPGLTIHTTALVGEHPGIADILQTRLRQVTAGSPLLWEVGY